MHPWKSIKLYADRFCLTLSPILFLKILLRLWILTVRLAQQQLFFIHSHPHWPYMYRKWEHAERQECLLRYHFCGDEELWRDSGRILFILENKFLFVGHHESLADGCNGAMVVPGLQNKSNWIPTFLDVSLRKCPRGARQKYSMKPYLVPHKE